VSARRTALRESDAHARRLARTLFDRPLVIEAGAGTGKTTVLVTRIVAWCLGPGWERARSGLPGEHPDRVGAQVARGVVAITFTEAAAAEMGTRLADALRDVEAGEPPRWLPADALPPDPAARAERARALRGALDQLRVQTIHAFCRRLIVSHPVEAGVHPRLEVDAEGALREEVVRDAIEELLPEAFAAPGSAALRLAALGDGPAEIEQALLALLDGGLVAADLSLDPFTAERLAELHGRLRAALDAFLAAAVGFAELGERSKARQVHDAVERLRAELGSSPWRDAAALGSFAELCRGEWDEDDSLAGRLRKWGAGDLIASEALVTRDPDALAAAAAELGPLLDHLGEIEPERLRLACDVLGALLGEVESRLRARGVATFPELLRRASDLLVRHPSVAERERSRIDQLLVDEFQDTDRTQCDALRALALSGQPEERPGLFLVGDPKQSIYGWRSADLAAYEDFVEAVRAAGGEVARLSVNYRSVPAVLAEVERVVAPVMEREARVQPGFEPLLEREDLEEQPLPAELAPIEYWVPTAWDAEAGAPSPRTLAGEANELEAAALARELSALHAAGALAWKEVGVLFRGRGDLEVYLEALRDAGIPYAVEGDRSYFQRREIVDAAALVRAIAEPNDHLALLGALRSPLAGVPDAALLPLWREGFPERAARLVDPCPEKLAELRELAARVAAELPGDVPGIEGIAGWHEGLVALLAAVARLRRSLRDDAGDVFVERLRTLTLVEATEAARHLGPWRVANLERFFRELAESLAGEGGVRALLRALRRAVAEGQRREESRPREAAEDAVQVMTIHGAKGLDFRHVYLMQLHKGPGGDAAERVLTGRPFPGGPLEYRVLGARTPGFDRVARERERVAEAERVRALYVAMTRAEERLVLAGLWPRGGPDGKGSLAGLVARGRRPAVHPDARMAELAATGAGDRTDAEAARFVFPALSPAAPERGATPRPDASGAPGPKAVAAASRALAEAREAARARAARPFAATASAAAEEDLADLAERRFGEAPRRPPRGGEAEDSAVARAVGVAIHRVLEELDLAADPEPELARARARLEALVRGAAEPGACEAARERGLELLERVAGGRLLARLRGLGANVLYRELPVIVPGDASEGAVGATAGVVDLVYRDPASGELVVVDYKTDRVESAAELRDCARRYAPQGAVYQRALREALSLAYTPRFELWLLHPDRIA
jgi:ATP-dependent helicase/nuclease subunit A